MRHTLYFPQPGLDRVFDHALTAVFVAAAAVIHLLAVRDVALQAHLIFDFDLREGHAVIAAHVWTIVAVS